MGDVAEGGGSGAVDDYERGLGCQVVTDELDGVEHGIGAAMHSQRQEDQVSGTVAVLGGL